MSSEPADGVSLQAVPDAVRLTFTEEPDPGLSSIDVLDDRGASVATGPASVVPGDRRSMRVGIASGGTGVYTVVWRVLSQVDGHFTAGAFAFGIGVEPSEIEVADPAAVSSPPLSPAEPSGRALIYLGLAVSVGSAYVWAGVFGSRRDGLPALLLAGAASAFAGTALLAFAQRSATGAGWGVFLGSSVGRALLWRLALLSVAVIAMVWALRRHPIALWVVCGAGVAFMGVHSASGHAATGSYAWLKIATQMIHFGAASVWIGGLAALLVGTRGAPDADRGRAVRRYSAVAGISLAVVVGTGTARAVAEIGTWSALWTTGYGRIVAAKIVLLAMAAALAARNRWKNLPEVDRSLRGLRRVSAGELTLAASVFALTAVLASLVPSRSASLAEPASAVELEGSDFAGDVEVRLSIAPGYPGANRFRARVDVREGPSPAGVTLRLSSQEAGIADVRVGLRRSGDVWEARSAAVAVPGTWRAVVLLDRGERSVEVPLTFRTRCRTPAPTTSGPPRIFDLDLQAVGSVQTYADPGSGGRNEIHFTFFDPSGTELEVADGPEITAYEPDGDSLPLGARRFSAGHFIGGGELETGPWIFVFEGASIDGEGLNACFEDHIS